MALSKNQKRRQAKKEKKKLEALLQANLQQEEEKKPKVEEKPEEEVVVEYVSADVQSTDDDPSMAVFKDIFKHFHSAEELTGGVKKVVEEDPAEGEDGKDTKEEDGDGEDGGEEGDGEEGTKKLSKKQRKKLKRLEVAELKQLVMRADVVEAHDVTSADPRLLVHLKSYRNTVPVPRHWCHKRKYLQGKRGIEKPPFELPDFIKNTGISEVRSSVLEADELKKAGKKAREKSQPKMGKVDIDYQVLHDAFFRLQTKPKLSCTGDLYYEGKEFEVKLKQKTPGILSDSLKEALGMPDGAPPPWLINMQRYGPPPAYPKLKIPGLNAPIPDGASYGYHPGGWGKVPVDEYGNPLYGNAFGDNQQDGGGDSLQYPGAAEEQSLIAAMKERWGETLEDSDDESEDDADDGEDGAQEEEGGDDGTQTPMTDGGIQSVSSLTSGMETPESIDLRKSKGTDTPETPQLFHVLQQKETSVGGALFGSAQTYDMSSAKKRQTDSGVEVSMTGGELDNMDDETLKAKYEQQLQEQNAEQNEINAGVTSVMLEEQRKRKRKMQKQQDAKNKKYKDFKF